MPQPLQFSIERLVPGASARAARIALFDFDGTVSLIRSGWMDSMLDMMLPVLEELSPEENRADLRTLMTGLVAELIGKPTIYQMIAFNEQVRLRGGTPEDPAVSKARYLARLMDVMGVRRERLRSGADAPERHLVPGTIELLHGLRDRGLTLCLASGTEEPFLIEETALLGLDVFFQGRIWGARDADPSFTKQTVVRNLVQSYGLKAGELLGFGDGADDIVNFRAPGGIAIGLATSEPACDRVDPAKRERLMRAGAHAIIPHYLGRIELFDMLFPPA